MTNAHSNSEIEAPQIKNSIDNFIAKLSINYLSQKYDKTLMIEELKKLSIVATKNNFKFTYAIIYLASVLLFLSTFGFLDELLLISRNFKLSLLALVSIFLGSIVIWQRCDEIHPSFKLLLKYSIIFRTFIYGSLFYGVSALIYFEIFTNGWLIPLLKGEISWFVRNFEYFSKII